MEDFFMIGYITKYSCKNMHDGIRVHPETLQCHIWKLIESCQMNLESCQMNLESCQMNLESCQMNLSSWKGEKVKMIEFYSNLMTLL
jgi:hypothetical protein